MPTETRDGSLVAMICSLEQRRLCGQPTHMNRELQYAGGGGGWGGEICSGEVNLECIRFGDFKMQLCVARFVIS